MKEVAQKEVEHSNNEDKSVFYQSVRIAMQGNLNYVANISKEAANQESRETDPLRRENLQQMANICKQVPANPAQTYREAVNSLWICQVCILADNLEFERPQKNQD